MKRFDAITVILDLLKDEDVALFTTGMISRDAFCAKDREANFYMLGSMGLVSAVGLGIALNTNKKVVIFDGDGSILMDMGSMAMTASFKPKNLIHIVLDNESYQSTGNQPSISKDIDLSRIASGAGYDHVYKIDKENELTRIFSHVIEETGPSFLLLKVESESLKDAARISLMPEALTRRIKGVIA